VVLAPVLDACIHELVVFPIAKRGIRRKKRVIFGGIGKKIDGPTFFGQTFMANPSHQSVYEHSLITAILGPTVISQYLTSVIVL